MKLMQQELKKLLHYNPITGRWTWIEPLQITHKFGDIAGHVAKNGYLIIGIYKKNYYAHRLAFLYMEGYWPENVVDHIDKNQSNNIWTNLREVTQQCNTRNQKISKNNTSGVTGVHWCTAQKKWTARIKINKRPVHIGRFKNFDDAVLARYVAEVKHGFPVCSESTAKKYLKIRKLPLHA